MSSFFELLLAAPGFAVIGVERKLARTFRILASFTSSLFTLTLLMLIALLPGLQAKVLPDIYWNSTNPIFRIDNTEHVFVVKIHDRVDFVCPYYTASSMMDQGDVEAMEIYSVSKWAYDYCAVSSDSVLAGVCNNPFQRTYATIVFREYTPKPGGLEFKPGRSYYFISTSTGQPGGIQNKQGGLCSAKNMKVKFEVEPLDNSGVPPSRSGDGRPVSSGDLAQGKSSKRGDDDRYDEYELVASVPGEFDPSGDNVASSSPSRTHDNSRETKKQNQNRSGWNELDVTTPQLYEIHTRPESDLVDVKRTDHRENYGTNAHQKRNASSNKSNDWRTLVLSLVLCFVFFMSRFSHS